jgi:DNA-binding NarL/FixJ family response regulator
VAEGKTNAEIAQALSLSVGTVKIHVEHIIAKLGVSDRTQAAVRALELGLLAPLPR